MCFDGDDGVGGKRAGQGAENQIKNGLHDIFKILVLS